MATPLEKVGTKPEPGKPLTNTIPLESIITNVPPALLPILDNLRDWIALQAGEIVANVAIAVISATITVADNAAEVIGAILGHLDAFREQGHVAGYATVAPTPLLPQDIINQVYRNLRSPAEFLAEMRRNGLSTERASLLMSSSRPIIDIGGVQELYRRGLLSPGKAEEAFGWHGFTLPNQQYLRELAHTHYGPPDILAAYRRQLFSQQQATGHLGKVGFKPGDVPLLLQLTRELLTPGDIVTAWLREDYTQEAMDKALAEHGYTFKDRAQIRKLAFFIPPIPDLVRFAVREAFSPEQVRALDLDQEFPPDFATWAKKQGVSNDWAHKYWQAHWELPSATQAFEMFHRTTHTRLDPSSPVLGTVNGKPYYRVISEATLNNLLKAQDYAPTWRPKMKEISYNPLTRVDIRRMYELGFLDKAGVAKAYHDDGYSPENVERITNFVEADVYDNYAGKVKVQLLTLFRRGIVSEAQLRAYLARAKVPPHFIDALVKAEIELREAEQLDKRVKAVEQQYKRGQITHATMIVLLGALQLSGETIEHLVTLWANEKLAARNRISIKDLKKAHNQHIVSDDKLRDELRERNWQADDIEILVKLDGPIDSEDAPVNVFSS